MDLKIYQSVNFKILKIVINLMLYNQWKSLKLNNLMNITNYN